MDKIKELLTSEIERELATLEDLPMGDDKVTRESIECLTKLLDRRIEIEKMELDNQQKTEKQNLDYELKEKELETQKIETELKEKQIKDERIDKIVKNVLTGFSIVSGGALVVWGTITSIKFEENGTFTTIVGRGFVNKLFHKV